MQALPSYLDGDIGVWYKPPTHTKLMVQAANLHNFIDCVVQKLNNARVRAYFRNGTYAASGVLYTARGIANLSGVSTCKGDWRRMLLYRPVHGLRTLGQVRARMG